MSAFRHRVIERAVPRRPSRGLLRTMHGIEVFVGVDGDLQQARAQPTVAGCRALREPVAEPRARAASTARIRWRTILREKETGYSPSSSARMTRPRTIAASDCFDTS